MKKPRPGDYWYAGYGLDDKSYKRDLKAYTDKMLIKYALISLFVGMLVMAMAANAKGQDAYVNHYAAQRGIR